MSIEASSLLSTILLLTPFVLVIWFINFAAKLERWNKTKMWYINVIALVISLIASYFLYGKFEYNIRVARSELVIRSEVHNVTLLKTRGPKHYYVTFHNNTTGQTLEQYVSKHCNASSKNKPGNTYNLAVSVRKNPMLSDKEYAVFVNLQGTFCP